LHNNNASKGTRKTYLRSTSHLVLNDFSGNRLRSILVALQFILYLPSEVISVALWPFVCNIFQAIHYLIDSLFFLINMNVQAIYYGFLGYLEASEDPNIPEID